MQPTNIIPKKFHSKVILIKYSILDKMLQNVCKECNTFTNSSLQPANLLKKLSISDSNGDHSLNLTYFATTK